MSISVITSPRVVCDQVIPVNYPVLWVLSMDNTNSATEVRRLGYQLILDNGDPLTAPAILSPKNNEEVYLDFQSDVFDLVCTKPPICESSQGEDDASLLVRLKYWEVVTDKELCETTDENITSTSNVRILNTYWDYRYCCKDYILLSPKLEYTYLCYGSLDQITLMYFANMSWRYTFEDDTTLVQNRAPLSTQHPSTFSIQEYLTQAKKVKKIEVNVVTNNEQVDHITTYIFKDCCESCNQIAFLSKMGGYSFVDFEYLEGVSIERTTNLYNKYQDFKTAFNNENWGNTDRLIKEGGLSQLKPSGKTIRTFVIELTDDWEFWEDMFRSGSYYIRICECDECRLYKFIPNFSNTQIYKKDNFVYAQFTGYINRTDLNSNNYV